MCPIKGLSENRRLIRIGKIHLGIKVKNKNGVEYPRATDYFVCPPEVQEVYGEQPDRLDIIIPVEDDEMWCHQYYRQYSRTRGLVCKGTGETCNRKLDPQTGAIVTRDSKDYVWKEMDCAGRECPDYQAKKCQETMNLQFLLPRVPGLGVWQIDTGSINSIRNINDNAAMLRAVCDRVSWIPLTLTLEPKEVVNPDDGKKKVVRCLNLRHDKGLLEILAARDKPRTALLIPMPAEDQEPLDEIPDENEVIEVEVAPPSKPKGGRKVIDAETGEIIEDDLEKELFGKAEEAGAAAPEEAHKIEEPTGTAVPAKLKLKRDPETITSRNELLSACFRDYNMQPQAVAKELGYRSQSDITGNFADYYRTIALNRQE